ncbi:hypothetical protein Emag_003668 [Eimeria magna]
MLTRLQQILTNQEDVLLQANACELLSAVSNNLQCFSSMAPFAADAAAAVADATQLLVLLALRLRLMSVTWGMDYIIREGYPEAVARWRLTASVVLARLLLPMNLHSAAAAAAAAGGKRGMMSVFVLSLFRMICDEEDAEVDELENQTLMRLLCNMAAARPPECARLMELEGGLLTTTLSEYSRSTSKLKREEAMVYWGILCSSPECVQTVLQKLPDSADRVADCLGDIEELAAAALASWLCVMQAATDISVLPAKMREVICAKLTPRLLDCVLQRPFPEFRQKAYELLKEKFRQLMLDPTSDSEYEVRIAKHAFAREVCDKQEEWLREALDPAFSNELFRYAKGGPFSGSSAQLSKGKKPRGGGSLGGRRGPSAEQQQRRGRAAAAAAAAGGAAAMEDQQTPQYYYDSSAQQWWVFNVAKGEWELCPDSEQTGPAADLGLEATQQQQQQQEQQQQEQQQQQQQQQQGADRDKETPGATHLAVETNASSAPSSAAARPSAAADAPVADSAAADADAADAAASGGTASSDRPYPPSAVGVNSEEEALARRGGGDGSGGVEGSLSRDSSQAASASSDEEEASDALGSALERLMTTTVSRGFSGRTSAASSFAWRQGAGEEGEGESSSDDESAPLTPPSEPIVRRVTRCMTLMDQGGLADCIQKAVEMRQHIIDTEKGGHVPGAEDTEIKEEAWKIRARARAKSAGAEARERAQIRWRAAALEVAAQHQQQQQRRPTPDAGAQRFADIVGLVAAARKKGLVSPGANLSPAGAAAAAATVFAAGFGGQVKGLLIAGRPNCLSSLVEQ